MTLDDIRSLFARAGAVTLYAKRLAVNDNSKQQVYFGSGFGALNLIPSRSITTGTNGLTSTFKAGLDLSWLLDNGSTEPAPGAQLILYPDYPEVRFSGFLRGCAHAPSELMRSRLPGRILLLGITADRRIIGRVLAPESEAAGDFAAAGLVETDGVFIRMQLTGATRVDDARDRLVAELRRINGLGWIDAKQRSDSGIERPCNAPQCGGYTLEAELGIGKNSLAEPDFLGWEVKQHAVRDFARPASGNAITLMTPEPDGGYYVEAGVEAFIRRYGYPDHHGRPDRLNFGGVHRMDVANETSGMIMHVVGYDRIAGRISQASGQVILTTARGGEVAASWSLSSLLAHWARKHARAAYVPSMKRRTHVLQYAYGHIVRLAAGTDPLGFVDAMLDGVVYYDPGIKLEQASTSPRIKRRSQFRVASKNIEALYGSVQVVNVRE